MTMTELTPGTLPPQAADLAHDMLDLYALRAEEPLVLADLWRALADRWAEIGYSIHERKCRQREMKCRQSALNQMARNL